jgi:hypothetical protein
MHDPVSHDARVQVTPDEPQHLFVLHPSCDPRHQSVVADPIKERVQVHLNAPPRVTICDELACPLDRLMDRAPRPETEAMGMEVRIEDRREHLR